MEISEQFGIFQACFPSRPGLGASAASRTRLCAGLSMIEDTDDLSWLARKADRLRRPLDAGGPRGGHGSASRRPWGTWAPKGAATPECAADRGLPRGSAASEALCAADRGLPRGSAASEALCAALLAELHSLGVRGSREDRTLYHRRLPRGCRGCLSGKGSNFYVTGLCTRDCFFCFNERPRRDEMVAHGIRVQRAEDAADIARRYGLRSVGLSGGEPLLFPDRVLALTRALKALPFGVRVEVYTNGDRADEALLKELKAAGVDGLRFNLAANGFDASPVERALRWFDEVVVEVPVVPSQAADVERMALALDELGASCLVVHELFACRENAPEVAAGGYSLSDKRPAALQWEPVAGGDEAALGVLAFAARRCRRLAAYYCSCRTQELISRRGLLRRARLAEAWE